LVPSAGGMDIQFSYTLRTFNSETLWKSRLDHYYQHGKSDIMMKELIITFVTILLFGCCVAGYVQRSIQSDFAILYGSENNTVNREQVGWHNLTTDLFRTPREP